MMKNFDKGHGFPDKQSFAVVENLFAILMVIFFSFMISSCVMTFKETLKQSGINKLVGQAVYNRTNFRSIKKNKIGPTNIYHKGVLIPAGSICIIQDISKDRITFLLVGGSSKDNVYELEDWLIEPDEVDIRLSFYKFFVENKDNVGLQNIRPEYYHGVASGHEQIGMNKDEALMCLGYPAYVAGKNSTSDKSRDFIIEQNDWTYLKGRFDKYLLLFKDGELFRTDD